MRPCYNEAVSRKIIIIRGNSGSGKSTIARYVRDELGEKVMFLQQDVLRRDILKVADKAGNPVVGLIQLLAMHGRNNDYDILLEGILSEHKYGEMLRNLIPEFDKAFVYYLDISFEETLRRHNLRHKHSAFGETEMREWWLEKDFLNVKHERIFDEYLSEEEVTNKILQDIRDHSNS